MSKNNLRFWLFYCAAWLLYGACLGGVFLSAGNRLNLNLLLTLVCNVAPAVLLGLPVFQICGKLRWSERRRPLFVLIHLLSLLSFSALWCFFNLLALSLLLTLQRGVWSFVRWDLFAAQWQLFSGVMAYATIASAVYVKQTSENLRIEERRSAEFRLLAVRAEAARTTAELSALRAQLNPHFLFNTLHSLMALVRTDADTAEEAIERFASMLRYVLQSQEKSKPPSLPVTTDITFGEEWNFVQNYLELERLRLGERLQLTTEIEPATLAFRLPAFTLQPIVENAVKHAAAPRAGGGRLHIVAYTDNGSLIVEVCDDGGGKSSTVEQTGNGLGLRLVRESLALRFGSAASLETETSDSGGFKVSITIPGANPPENFLVCLKSNDKISC